MIMKINGDSEKKIIALCDDELQGKVIEENDLVLDLSSDFYKGEKVSDDDVENILKDAYIINAVGENTICFLKKINLVNEDEIKKINDVPHVQILLADI